MLFHLLFLHLSTPDSYKTQRKIFTFAEEYLPRLGYRKRAHLMNTMVPGLAGGKMSSSDPNSKIDILDTPEAVRKKIRLAFCEEGNVEENGVLAFVQAVLIPISQMRIARLKGDDTVLVQGSGDPQPLVGDGAPEGTVFSVVRDEKFGGSLHYRTFDEMEKSFKEKELHPGDLKAAVARGIIDILEPIRKAFEADEEWQRVEKLAYPDPNAKAADGKKKKKVVVESCSLHILLTSILGKGLPSTSTGKRKECTGGGEWCCLFCTE